MQTLAKRPIAENSVNFQLAHQPKSAQSHVLLKTAPQAPFSARTSPTSYEGPVGGGGGGRVSVRGRLGRVRPKGPKYKSRCQTFVSTSWVLNSLQLFAPLPNKYMYSSGERVTTLGSVCGAEFSFWHPHNDRVTRIDTFVLGQRPVILSIIRPVDALLHLIVIPHGTA